MSTYDDPDRRWLVILVDDDRRYLDNYKAGLETFCRRRSDLEVHTFFDAHDAVKAVEHQDPQRETLWILDSMMPFDREQFDIDATQQGLLTGIVLLRKLVSSSEGRGNQRYLIVTNYDVNALGEELANVETEGIHSKLSCSPKRLARIVDNIIDSAVG